MWFGPNCKGNRISYICCSQNTNLEPCWILLLPGIITPLLPALVILLHSQEKSRQNTLKHYSTLNTSIVQGLVWTQAYAKMEICFTLLGLVAQKLNDQQIKILINRLKLRSTDQHIKKKRQTDTNKRRSADYQIKSWKNHS